MIFEMLALVLIAVMVFGYVLAPIVLHREQFEIVEEADLANAEVEAVETVAAEKQPVHDRS